MNTDTITEHGSDTIDHAAWKSDHITWAAEHREGAAILERAQQELDTGAARILAHVKEIALHEQEIADQDKSGHVHTATYLEAEHAKHQQAHGAIQTHHQRIMKALRALDVALKS